MPYYIYKLIGQTKYNTYHYIGSTPDPKKRLRQHCGYISGGAKCTSSKLSSLLYDPHPWNFLYILMTFFPKNIALSLEWQMKMPFATNGLRKRGTRYSKNIDEMLLQIDLVIDYVLKKHEKNIKCKQIFMFIDAKIGIIYEPKNFIIKRLDDLVESILENNIISMLSYLDLY